MVQIFPTRFHVFCDMLLDCCAVLCVFRRFYWTAFICYDSGLMLSVIAVDGILVLVTDIP